MRTQDPRYAELMTLICERLDERDTPESCTRLDAYLLESDDACSLYLDLADLHATLCWEAPVRHPLPDLASTSGTTNAISSPEIAPPFRRPSTPVSLSPKGPVLGFLRRTSAAFHRPKFWATLAAGLLFAGYVVAISWNMLDKPLPSGTDGNDGPVATIRDTQDATWFSRVAGRSTPASPPISDIKQGEPLGIDSGLVELQLKQGATLLVEGPAEWFIDGNNEAMLKRGKLVATVPNEAVGFTIRTPSAQVVDLGTEFGIEVLKDGTSRVDVFRGKVQVHATGKFGEYSASRLLRASESTTISPSSPARSQLQVQAAEPDRFHRHAPPADPQWTRLPVQSYRYCSSIGPAPDEFRNDPESRKLVDGAGGSFTHNDGAWVGFNDAGGLQRDADPGIPRGDDKQPQPAICFVLERPARALRLQAVQIKYLIQEQFAIRAPSLVRIRTAESEAALQSALWTEFASLDDEPAVKGLNAGTVKTATLPLPEVHGPHIEIEFYNHNEWTYLSEISFLQARRKEALTKDNR